ncbi:nuclear transport factor 2 family protein [Chryseobacterium sp. G0240]|uniref:nuclear transport factor 2 family protein n=1 Tax=Chryseobacterium sp. G0240 TaxID=2487066 RepID=UPI000F44D3B8|nr:nuclear transport factor 2 family protein [Chryseobacterium sp. G0240]ROI01640.1 nuclear transport factor 2 family protein [Chryseobacterium sp. G0240]
MINDIRSELAQKFLTALKEKNYDLIGSIMHEEVTWDLPGESIISEWIKGRDQIVDRARTIISFGVDFQLNHILYGPEGFALSLHNQAVRNDLVLDEYLVTVCVIKDGKIFSIVTYLSDPDGINAFFVEE